MFLSKEFHNHGTDRQYCKLSFLLCSKNVTHTTQQISLSLFFLKSTKILENNKNNKKIVVCLEKSYQKEETASNTTKRKTYSRVYMSLTAQANLQVVTL